jgi:histone acetyltransferase (RNA polymerase elongator complex component)
LKKNQTINSESLKLANFKQMTIPIFIPHLGCGHACTFCNQKAISGVEREPEWSEKQIVEQIDLWLSTTKIYDRIEIAFFGGSFTGIPVALQEQYLQIGQSYLETGKIQGVRLSTRPDYMDQTVAKRLKRYGVTLVELGVQSFCDEVLTACHRGHDRSQIDNAVNVLKDVGIDFGIQLMIGLPKDTPERFLESVRSAIKLKPSCVRLYPTLVLEQTELANELEQGIFKPLALNDAVTLALEAYLLFNEAGIPVIRMGLQASETLSNGMSVLAGPHHDAFRTLVESQMYKRLMERDLENGLPDTRLCVRVHPKHVSFFSGYKQENIKWLESKGIRLDKIIKDETIPFYKIEWVVNHEG